MLRFVSSVVGLFVAVIVMIMSLVGVGFVLLMVEAGMLLGQEALRIMRIL